MIETVLMNLQPNNKNASKTKPITIVHRYDGNQRDGYSFEPNINGELLSKTSSKLLSQRPINWD